MAGKSVPEKELEAEDMDRAPTDVVLARLRGVLDAVHELLVLVDPDGRILESTRPR